MGQNEDNEIGPRGIIQEEEVQIEDPQVLKGGGQEEKKPQIA